MAYVITEDCIACGTCIDELYTCQPTVVQKT